MIALLCAVLLYCARGNAVDTQRQHIRTVVHTTAAVVDLYRYKKKAHKNKKKLHGGPSTIMLYKTCSTLARVPFGTLNWGYPIRTPSLFYIVLVPHHVPTPLRGITVRASRSRPTTRTLSLALTRTLWGDRCLDAVACEGSRLIRPTWMLCLERL